MKRLKANREKTEEYSFSSQLFQDDHGIRFHYVEFPHDVSKLFGKKGQVRIIMQLNGHSFRRALIPNSSGFHRIIIGGDIRKKTGVIVGDKLQLQIKADPEPLPLVVPEELVSIFEMEPDIPGQFEKLAPGMKRNICTWISEGKKVETRVNRALEVMKRFQSGKFHFGGQTSKNK